MGGSGLYAPLLIALLGGTGLTGAIVALVKLRGDRDSAAVSQAHGANEALVAALTAVERERDYWRNRYEKVAALNEELLRRAGTT